MICRNHNRITVMYTNRNGDFSRGFLFYHVCAAGNWKYIQCVPTDNRFRTFAIWKGENLPNWQNIIFASSLKYRWSTFSWNPVTFARNFSNRKINSIEFCYLQLTLWHSESQNIYFERSNIDNRIVRRATNILHSSYLCGVA